MTLHVRWLATVPYDEALAVQRALVSAADDWLLLLEHPHVVTLGRNARESNVLVDPDEVDLVRTDRGGDVTYHGPGQLVGYPIVSLGGGGMTGAVAHVRTLETLLVEVLGDLGLDDVGVIDRRPGVWVAPRGDRPRKIAAIGTRITRQRTMHGFALNVDPDLARFGDIIPCGITDMGVTSLEAEGIDVPMRRVVDAVVSRALGRWSRDRRWDRLDVAWLDGSRDPSHLSAAAEAQDGPGSRLRGRLADAGVGEGVAIAERKPPWLRAKLDHDDGFARVRHVVRERKLATVCEEAGCPNISECWSSGTATFMINGERCTRGCAFCLVDTRKPMPLDPTEPERIADAVEAMGLDFAVITAVARDDLDDGGASGFVAAIEAIHSRTPGVAIEVLIPDCQGDPVSLGAIFDARPDVLNHNLETVPRLQRAVRPQASYARSLSVLSRAKASGLTTKSGLIVGMGESDDEVEATLADLHGVGVDIVTIGQYLRPTATHLPVARWVEPETFARWKVVGEAMGIGHVESSPLTRSSYHARRSASHLSGSQLSGSAPSVDLTTPVVG